MGEPGTVETAAPQRPEISVAADAGGEREGSTRAWVLARVLLVIGLVLLLLSALSAFRPLTNPGVQDCGGPIPFLVLGRENRVIHLGDTGEVEEAAHSRQPTCRDRALDEVGRAGRLFVAFLVVTGLGAAIGLVDDHLALRRQPRFETYLRDLPYEGRVRRGLVPAVSPDDLASALPPIEVPEVAGIVGWALAAAVVLPIAGSWGATIEAFASVRLLPLVGVLLVLAGLWAAAARLRARLGGVRIPWWPDAVAEAVASSWQATVRPLTGAAGVDVHDLRRRRLRVGPAVAAVQVLVSVALVAHAALLVAAGLLVAFDPHPPTVVKEPQLLLISVVVVATAMGLCRLGTRWRGLPVRPSWAAFGRLDRLAARPEDRLAAVGLTLVQPIGRIVILALVLNAFGASVPLDVVALVALLGPVMVALAPTPGGSGVVEAMTMLLLMLVGGVDPGRAAAVALTVRLLTYWLPLAPGLLAARRWVRAA